MENASENNDIKSSNRTASDQSRLRHALALAEAGFYIHPLRPGSKEPVQGVDWKNVRSGDPQTIRDWFVTEPDMNFGVSGDGKHTIIALGVDAETGKSGEGGSPSA